MVLCCTSRKALFRSFSLRILMNALRLKILHMIRIEMHCLKMMYEATNFYSWRSVVCTIAFGFSSLWRRFRFRLAAYLDTPLRKLANEIKRLSAPLTKCTLLDIKTAVKVSKRSWFCCYVSLSAHRLVNNWVFAPTVWLKMCQQLLLRFSTWWIKHESVRHIRIFLWGW